MLDNLPPIVRHLIIGLLMGLLGWGSSDLVPWLGEHGPAAAIAGVLLGQVLLVVTPLVRQYGVGARRPGMDR